MAVLVEANRDKQHLRGPRNSNCVSPRLLSPHSHLTPPRRHSYRIAAVLRGKDKVQPLLRTQVGHPQQAPKCKKPTVKFKTEVMTLKRKGNNASGILVCGVKRF